MGGGASKKKLKEAEERAEKANAELKKHQDAAEGLRKANQDMEEELKKTKDSESKIRKDHSQLEQQLNTERTSKSQIEDQMRQETERKKEIENQLHKEVTNHKATQNLQETMSRDLNLAEERAKSEAATLKEQHRQHEEQVGRKLRDAEVAAETARKFQTEVEARERDLRTKLEDTDKQHVCLQSQIKSEYEAAMSDLALAEQKQEALKAETSAAESVLQSSYRDLQESYAKVEADCEAALSRETEKAAKIRDLTSKVQTAEDQQKALELQLANASAQSGVQTDLPTRQAMEKLAQDLKEAEMRQYNLEAELSAAWAEAETISFYSGNPAIKQASANFLWRPKLF